MLLYIFIIYYISMSAECLCYIMQVIFFVVDIHIHINLIKAVKKQNTYFYHILISMLHFQSLDGAITDKIKLQSQF